MSVWNLSIFSFTLCLSICFILFEKFIWKFLNFSHLFSYCYRLTIIYFTTSHLHAVIEMHFCSCSPFSMRSKLKKVIKFESNFNAPFCVAWHFDTFVLFKFNRLIIECEHWKRGDVSMDRRRKLRCFFFVLQFKAINDKDEVSFTTKIIKYWAITESPSL